MKIVYLTLAVLFLLQISPELLAQPCPPPGFAEPGNTCITAPVLCDNIGDYCATINNNNQSQSFPGCPNNQLNNDEWFAFVAGTTTITIEVVPSNCTSNGNFQGMQAGIYRQCVSMPIDLQCSCTENPFILTSNNFVVGQTYYFVADGCAGDVCDYDINVLAGSTVPPPPANPGPITGPDTVCVGSTTNYTTPSVSGATIYTWTLDPALGTLANGTTTSKNITWGNTPGTTTLCVQASNSCLSNPNLSCIDIVVIPKPTAEISGSGVLCQGTAGTVTLTVTFTGTGPWTFVYRRNGVNQPAITTSENPYTFTVNQVGTYTLQSVNTGAATNCAGTVSGTATVTQVNIMPSTTTVAANCGLSNGSVNLSHTGGDAPFTYVWAPGGETTQDLADVPGGTYTVTITDDNGCTKTATATVANNNITFTVTGTTTAATTCLPPGNGSINVSVAPGGTYTYEWAPGGETTEDLSNLPAGTYTITVSAGGNCTQTQSFTVADQPNQPNLTTGQVNTTCDLSNGSINLSVSGGVAPYTFEWEPDGQTTEDLASIPAGTYTVTVTGANGCTKTAQATVTNNNPPFTITPTIVTNTTCDPTTGNGSISLSVSPGGSYTFVWDYNGATTSSISNLLPGTYAVTVSAGGSCTQEQSYTVPDLPNQPNLSSTQINTTCDLSNGSINLSVSGGVAPYTYEWAPGGETTQDLGSLLAGTYTVTVTGANGCTRTAEMTVTNNNPPFTINPTIVTNTTCNPTTGNGSISLSVSPGGTYTFVWDYNGATTSSISNLLPGDYTVTVSGGGSCTQEQTFTVPDLPNLPNLSATQINTTCDLSNGSINLSVSGGVAPYTYIWDPNGETTQDLGSIPAGTYTVTVTGANGCTRTTEVSVNNNNPTFNINPTIVANTTCNPTTGNGSISLSISPGGTYTFIWDYNGATTSSISNLLPGTYNVTVSGGGSCTQEQSFEVPDVPNLPNLSATTVNTTCELSNGSINLSVSGGVQPFTYMWSPNGQTTQDLSNIPSGTYDVTVTGANGCTAELNVTVDNDNPTFNINANILPSTTCNANGNGSINLNITPPGVYTYLWAPGGQTTANIAGLVPGTYTVTVSKGGACVQTEEFVVSDEPNLPELSFTTIDARCGLSNGSINLSVTGATQPYTYAWSSNHTVQDPANIPAGSYTVTVTGANGCSEVGFVDVNEESVPITANANIIGNTSCLPPGNGRLELTTIPANATVVWSNGFTTKTISNLQPGEYTVTITALAGGNCIEILTFEVPDERELPEIYPETVDANCGLANGSIMLDIVNGALPYKFKWNTNSTAQNLSNLLAGTYTVTVTTGLGCTAENTIIINDIDLNISIFGLPEPNTSCLLPNGVIYIDTDPNNLPFKYKWSNNATTRDLLNLTAGTYTITVTIGSCSASEPFDIPNAAEPPNLSASSTPSTCGQNNGTATATASGGIAPYKYKWSANASGSTAQTVNNLLAGTYTVTVTGDNGCTATSTVVVPNNNLQVTLTAALTENTSCVAGNGAIDLTAAPAGTYKYLWSNAATTQDLTNLATGVYTVTATLGVSCTSTAVYTIVQNTSDPNISPNITASICGASNGAVNLSIVGGIAPYTFAWSNMAVTEDLTGVLAGNYTVTVTAANGCTADTTLNVPNNSNTFSLAGAAVPLNNCAAANGSVGITVTSLVMPPGTFSFAWSNAALTEDIANLPSGTYTVTVSETGSACTASASFIVDDERLYPSATQSLQPEICGLSNGSIDATATGGVTPYTYLWSSGPTPNAEDLTGIAAGTYTLTVTGANGCTATTSAQVPDNAITFSLSGNTNANTACAPNNGAINLSVTPAGTYTFEWNNGIKTEDLAVIPGGNYVVTVSAGGTCTSVASFIVTDNTLAPILSEKIEAASCAKTNGSIDLSVSGSLAPFVFEWSNGPSTEDLASIPSGTYTATVTGANGCITINEFIVPENVIAPSISSVPTPNTTCGSNSGSISLSITPVAGPYTYAWSSGQTSPNLGALAPGLYTVTVDGGGACVSTATIEVLNATDAPLLSGNLTPSLCSKPDGTISLGVSGSTPPYTFKWSNGPTTKDISGLVPGTYTVTATGADGCVSTASYTVIEQVVLPQITGTTAPNTACAAPTGTVSINVEPFGTYTYVWSNGPITQNLSGLPVGSYTVTVNGGGSCISTATFEVLNLTDAPQISPNIKPSLCAQPDGAIDLSIVGGTLPYGFNWSNGAKTEDLTGILSGTYTVTVSASNGCSTTVSMEVQNNSNSFSIAGALTPNIACGYGNGAINVTMTPVDTYTFAWSNGKTSEDLSDLTAGTYTVTATDPGKCAASATFVILEEAKPVAASGTKVDILCFGEKNGSIDLTVSVGVQPFTYKWQPTQAGDPQDLTNIGAGIYAVTVTDAVGCTGTASFNILQPAAALALSCGMTKVVTQPGATNGEAEVVITGGTAPFTVSLSPGGPAQVGVPAGTLTFPNLGVGSYSTTVTDANGCSAVCNFNVGLEKCETVVGTMSAPTLSRCGLGCITATYSNIGQYLQPNDVLQFILHTGSSNIIAGEVARSTQPTFCFDPATMTYGTTYRISAVAGNNDGSGNVVLADYCTVVSFGTPVIFNEKPEAAIVPPLPINCDRLLADLVGSASIATSVFDWKTANGQLVGSTNQPTAQAGKAGLYTLIVTANTCADTAVVQVQDITNKPKAIVSASPDDILDCKIDEIVLSGVIEGTLNANTIWMSGGQFYSSQNPVKIENPGTYEFVILDTLTRCTDTAIIVINENLAFPPLFINPVQTITCQNPTVTLSGGSPFAGILFRWAKLNGTDTTMLGTGPTQVVNTPGTYVLIGVDPTNQCKNSAPVTVVADQIFPVANAGAGFTVECFGEIATLDGSASTGLPGFTFQWTTLDGKLTANVNTAVPTINEPGTYTLLVTNPNGCTDVAAVIIAPEVPVPVLDIVQPRCFGDKGRFAITGVQGGKPPFRYSLDGGQSFTTQSNFSGLTAGSVYNIFIVDSEGCTATTSVVLNQPTFFDIQVLPEIVQVALGDTYQIVPKLSVPASELGFIRWIPGKDLDCDTCLTPTFTAINTTYFKVMAEDTAGCPDEALFRIYVDKEPHVYIPNVFTPDKDGDNDVFMIFGDDKQVVKIRSFQIYSRWGEQVFEQYNFAPNDPTSGWDGRHRGTALNPAVFVWYAEIEFLDGNVVLYKGDVTLAR